MNTTKLRSLINLFESRVPGVEYEENDKEVIALLVSHDSQVYTKLAQKIERIAQLKEEVSALEEEVKQSAREDVAGIFNAADAVKTRIIKTKSLIVQISKDPEPTKSPKYKDILAVLETKMTPELIAVLEQLKKTMVTITQKAAGLKVKSLDEGTAGDLSARLDTLVNNWGQQYDQKLAALMQQAQA